MAHLKLSIVDKVNPRVRVTKSPSASQRTKITGTQSILRPICISYIYDMREVGRVQERILYSAFFSKAWRSLQAVP